MFHGHLSLMVPFCAHLEPRGKPHPGAFELALCCGVVHLHSRFRFRRQAPVRERIGRATIDPHLVMQVRPGRDACGKHFTDVIARRDTVADRKLVRYLAQMSISSHGFVAVGNLRTATVAAAPLMKLT